MDLASPFCSYAHGNRPITSCIFIRRIIIEERVPAYWRGSRLSNRHKKNDPLICDNYRGLSVTDHVVKVLTALLYDNMADSYERLVGPTQMGVVRGRGGPFPVHMLGSFMSAASAAGRSFFVLFVDLVKAFDYAVRELACGWKQGCEDASDDEHVKSLLDLNIPEEVALHIVSYIREHGSVLEKTALTRKLWRSSSPFIPDLGHRLRTARKSLFLRPVADKAASLGLSYSIASTLLHSTQSDKN